MNPSLQTVMSDVRAALGKPGRPIGPNTDAAPRFELFNGPNSICSQKTRAVMAAHEEPRRRHLTTRTQADDQPKLASQPAFEAAMVAAETPTLAAI